MTVRHDRSAHSIVTVCSECPHWFAFSFDIADADERAAQHKVNVHGMPESRARKLARDRADRARHAATG
jgi:hypothetical protein